MRRLLAVAIVLCVFVVPSFAAADDFAAGSLIIPMDTDYQDDGMLEAYGLVYHLLLDGVPVRWCIKSGKNLGESDFTATAEDYATSSSLTHDYRGGPFVIDAADAAAASTRIDSWQMTRTTTVHRATAQFSCDVSRHLVNAPTIAMVADGNQKIARGYLEAAGIPDSTLDYTWPDSSPDMLDIAELSGPTTTNHRDGALFDSNGEPVYCQLMSMHWGVNDANDDPEVVAEVREYLNFPTHFFAECQAVNAFENNTFGKFLTPNGFEIGDRPNAVDFYHADVPFAQIDGGWETVGGSEPAYSLPAGDAYKASDITMVTEQGTPEGVNDVWMTGFLDGVCPPEREFCDTQNFGKVSYLGGHEYDTKLPISQNPKTQGTRMFLNSLFEAPCATLGGQPDVSLFKFGPDVSTSDTITWTIEVDNPGISVANDVEIRDALPPGTTFVSATDGGQLVGNDVVWNVGTLQSGELVELSVTVMVSAVGDYDNTATATFFAGLNQRSSTSNTHTTSYCVPDDDATICAAAGAACGTLDMSDNCGQMRTVDCEVGACAAGAVCDPNNQCACAMGYMGDGITCTDIDECSSGTDTCDPNATCSNTVGAFDCACDAGFSGDGFTCTDIDECADGSVTCGTNATCNNLPGSAECVCNVGYMGDGFTCTDVDECTLGTSNCDANADCTNTDGSFTCACLAGFVGDGRTCIDVDECADGALSCGSNASCVNLPGSAECQCDTGYEGDGMTCTDVDECATGTDTCDTNATCANDVGGFTCACDAGYSGDGTTCDDIDECAAGTAGCDPVAICTNTDGGVMCDCPAGYDGDGATCTEAECGCADDEICVGDTCFARCDDNDECAADEACYAGRCATTACAGVSCADDETCAGGSCFAACSNNAECADGDCYDGRCTDAACAGISCAQGQICRGGSCFDACSDDADCAADEQCYASGCAGDPCDGIACPGDHECFDGGCFEPCGSDLTCSDPSDRCYDEERCANSACEFVVCAESEVCVQGGCFASCSNDDDCDAGSCVDGRCASDPCESIDCAAGETCTDGVCSPAGGGSGASVGNASEGCGCSSAEGAAGQAWLVLLALAVARRRRRRR